MAEQEISGRMGKVRPGGKRQKKLSTRVDLTSMVDLGFLLITFFIFTTAISRPKALALILPKDTTPNKFLPQKESAVITVMPGKGHRIYYYEGKFSGQLSTCSFAAIRHIILDKKRRSDRAWFMVIIKPTPDATYKDFVDILDEMSISQVEHYALVAISPEEYNSVMAQY